jgi:adenylate kinase
MLVIILLGAPGSGKGTQARMLEKKFNLKYVGSGDLLRARVKKKDYTGRKIKQVIDDGKRIPTPIMFNIWMNLLEELKKNSKIKGIVFDGSPRTLFEAEMLELALEWYGWLKYKKVILVDVSPKEVINRLTKRKICVNCGRIIPYIGDFKKLKKCDKCGGRLIRRADDNIKGIKERLGWFKTDVVPAINYYKKTKELIKVNGEQSIEDVFKDILKTLKRK